MVERIVDTNVAIVANRKDDWPPECQLACINILTEITRNGGLVLDGLGLIVEEYARHLSYSGQPGLGDAFFRWVHNNRYRQDRCTTVPINTSDDESFTEFPADPALASFDKADRKFVAAAVSHGSAEIVVGTDSDWWHHREALAEAGVEVRFACEAYHRARDAAGRR